MLSLETGSDCKDTDTRQFIRLDPEWNYRSFEFQAFVSSKGYSLERTPPRDKHAGGVAERAVGVIVAKINVAMLSPDNLFYEAVGTWK